MVQGALSSGPPAKENPVSTTTIHLISRQNDGLEAALSGLYREAQHAARVKRLPRRRADIVLAACNAGTWVYTLTSLLHQI
jgi:hypothetical protein